MYKYKVKNISIIPGNTIIIDIAPTNGEIFSYIPGQYVMLAPYDKKGYLMPSRPFSIASSPTQKGYLQFGIKITGKFTKRLSELKQGDKLFVYGPFGEFTYNEKYDTVLIAGGIGITPFINAIRYANDNQLAKNITLLYSNRKIVWTAFRDELKNISRNNKNIKTVFSITDESIPTGEENYENRKIDKNMILKYIENPVQNKIFYICGPSMFIKAMKDNLLSIGVAKRNIKYELFSVNKPATKSGNALLIYAGTFIALFFIIYSVNKISNANVKSKILQQSSTSSSEKNISLKKSSKLLLINQIAQNRKNYLKNLQKKSLVAMQKTINEKRLKLQENAFKRETSGARTRVPIKTKPKTVQKRKIYIPHIIRRPMPRTTIS